MEDSVRMEVSGAHAVGGQWSTSGDNDMRVGVGTNRMTLLKKVYRRNKKLNNSLLQAEISCNSSLTLRNRNKKTNFINKQIITIMIIYATIDIMTVQQ